MPKKSSGIDDHNTILTKQRIMKQELFLENLARTGNVELSARSAGYTGQETLHRARRADKDFAEQWKIAEEVSIYAAEDELRRRAIDGVNEPVFHKGKVVGEVNKRSDALLMFMLKAKKPEVYRDQKKEITINSKVGIAVLPMNAPTVEDWETAAVAVDAAQEALTKQHGSALMGQIEKAQTIDITANSVEVIRK